ncbi:hypothetical protein CJF42_14850 [Pseudoalteromonas sp. NBT06-2]|uniref:hypothetical protein n=1 Tax=Pseudoalteromonas sp. NBT06-2 TaxID=2025950 RepID=UPI000BA5D183|nr:hypothetical protein [Pseudoalteromonas sp. NBT06-2]PAJ73621.1 hypothetical protein CJF42_14850 [Pseudoalteromonas sp. NBT06-2]
MKVQILVTQNDFCIQNLECEFQSVGVNYQIDYIEDHPELVSENNIRHSPNIFVDGKLIFRHQPTTSELQVYFCS